jgi:outer membrane protein
MGVSALVAAPVVQAEDNPFLVRVRALHLNWDNGQGGALDAVKAENKTIPEVDLSYFFNKNLALELVLTYPQSVDVKLGSTNLGSVKALPPSLLLQYHFTDLGAFKPYVGLGVNYTLFTDRKLAGGAVKLENSTFGYAAQIGADYMFDKNWGLNIDLKYAKIEPDVSISGVKVGSVDLNPTMLGVGFTYKY